MGYIRGMGDRTLPYDPALDGIRAVAIAMVFCVHVGMPWALGGFVGVDVFFVLSGFLITRLLVKEHASTGRISIPRFYARRLKRLYPALLLLLGVTLALAPWLYPYQPFSVVLRDALVSSLYLADYAREFGWPPVTLGHMWSLSVEEHFYLVWPLILGGVLTQPRHNAIRWLVAIYAAATLWRLFGWLHWATMSEMYYRFDYRASGLALGCLLGYLNLRIRPIWGALGLAALIGIMFTFETSQERVYAYGFTVAEISAAILILAPQNWLSVGAWIGRMSYGIYLWHVPVIRVLRQMHVDWIWFVVLAAVGTIALAALSYYTVESIFRRSRPNAKASGSGEQPVLR